MYKAEHLFVRFHGRKSSSPIFRPNYWVDGSALRSSFARVQHFEGWLTDAEIAKLAKQHYRDIAAISHNWNALIDCELWKIELRGNEVVQGIEGPIAPQPTHQATQTDPASSSALRGGALQIYLDPRTPFVCTPVDWNAI
jgi:hypothetical protein